MLGHGAREVYIGRVRAFLLKIKFQMKNWKTGRIIKMSF